MKLKLGHCAFRTSNMEKSLDFYINVVGLKKHFTLKTPTGDTWLIYLKIDEEQFLELFYWEKPIDNSESPFRHICLMVDNAEEAARNIQAKGIKVFYGPTYLGNEAPVPFVNKRGKCGSFCFYIEDPDGNQVEFQEYTDLSLQTKTPEQLSELEPAIKNNMYIVE